MRFLEYQYYLWFVFFRFQKREEARILSALMVYAMVIQYSVFILFIMWLFLDFQLPFYQSRSGTYFLVAGIELFVLIYFLRKRVHERIIKNNEISESDGEKKKYHAWIFLGIGFVLMMASFMIMAYINSNK